MKLKRQTLTKEAIFRELRDNRALLDRYGVRKIGLFGSYAAGRQSETSDIDFFIEFDRPTFRKFMGLAQELEGLFQRKVDILTPGSLETIRVPQVADSIRKSLIYE